MYGEKLLLELTLVGEIGPDWRYFVLRDTGSPGQWLLKLGIILSCTSQNHNECPVACMSCIVQISLQ